jgi:hypothetical protein
MNNLEPVVKCYNSPDEVPEELDPNAKETYKYMLRQKRNELLKTTDIYLLPDFPITPDNLIVIKEFRQALRDFTTNNFILPDKPKILSI